MLFCPKQIIQFLHISDCNHNAIATIKNWDCLYRCIFTAPNTLTFMNLEEILRGWSQPMYSLNLRLKSQNGPETDRCLRMVQEPFRESKTLWVGNSKFPKKYSGHRWTMGQPPPNTWERPNQSITIRCAKIKNWTQVHVCVSDGIQRHYANMNYWVNMKSWIIVAISNFWRI